MSSPVNVSAPGFKAGDLFQSIASTLSTFSEAQRAAQIKKAKAVYLFNIQSKKGSPKTHIWVLDLKKSGAVSHGNTEGEALNGQPKPDISITLADETFVKLFEGKSNPTTEFMSGGIKIKGNMMLGMKLDGILKEFKSAAKAQPPAAASTKPVESGSKPSGSVVVDGFKGSEVLAKTQSGLASLSSQNLKSTVNKVNGIIQLDLTNGSGKTNSWTLNLKKGAGDSGNPTDLILLGDAAKHGKSPNVTLGLKDSDFVDMSDGKLSGQAAFMGGKLKSKGNIMLAMKLQDLLKLANSATKAKL
ncbi:hypothetical protein H4219_001132 [Mycoemilia scoparia]|uniref:SCP2 domain-containing protein n=1 Tax=Mycoemilia scoparia TaxID=417184 RepID=A0A9W8A6R7_9FUNG|nr:hypothetical protein H4219_001132 [Mycoemilia scoparia]